MLTFEVETLRKSKAAKPPKQGTPSLVSGFASEMQETK
jgi:hypothetical protein